MQMSHIYKPVMLQAVLSRSGTATKDEIAKDIISRDVLQREHYRKHIVQKQPGWRLIRDGALVRDEDQYHLAPPFDELSEAERLELIAECERRIETFNENYGDRFKSRNSNAVPGSLRYAVLKRAGGRCELCGVSHDEIQIDVDHITPRAKGGSNDADNLQALCRTCNANKRDTDDTDFRAVNALFEDRKAECLFCRPEEGGDDLAYVLNDNYPVTKGHTLVVPRRHVADYFDLHQSERNAIDRLLHDQREMLIQDDKTITGFNIGINVGASAGQTVFHVHIHLIPRRLGDMDDPRGGVRGVIPGKKIYE